MNIDQARQVAAELGMQCGQPGTRYRAGAQVFSLCSKSTVTVLGMQGGNVVASGPDGQEVLVYFEIGVTPAAAAA